jgi:hypothetical protein
MAVNLWSKDVYDICYLRAVEGDREAWETLSNSALGGDRRSQQLINLLESYNLRPDPEPELPERRPFRWPSPRKIIGGVVKRIRQRMVDGSGMV